MPDGARCRASGAAGEPAGSAGSVGLLLAASGHHRCSPGWRRSAASGLGALTPLLTQIAVDDATAGSTDGLGWVIAGLVALALIRFGSSFLRRWAGGRLSLDVQHDMRQDVFGALQRLDGSGQDRLRTGQVVSRATTDLQMVQGLLAMVPLAAGQVVLFVVSLVIMVVAVAAAHGHRAARDPGGRRGDQGDPDWCCSRPPGRPSSRRPRSPRSSRRTSPASGWSRGSARRSGRPDGCGTAPGGCSPTGCGRSD